jgi:hypothetical protein
MTGTAEPAPRRTPPVPPRHSASPLSTSRRILIALGLGIGATTGALLMTGAAEAAPGASASGATGAVGRLTRTVDTVVRPVTEAAPVTRIIKTSHGTARTSPGTSSADRTVSGTRSSRHHRSTSEQPRSSRPARADHTRPTQARPTQARPTQARPTAARPTATRSAPARTTGLVLIPLTDTTARLLTPVTGTAARVLSPATALQPVGDLLDTAVNVIALVPVAPLPPPLLPGTVVPPVLPPGTAPSPTAPGSPPTAGADATTTSGTDAPQPPPNGAHTLPGTALRSTSGTTAATAPATTAADAVRQHDGGPAPGSPAPPRTPLPAPTPVTYTGPGDTGSPGAHAVAVTCLPVDLPAATAAQIRPVRAPRGSSNAPDTRPG